ncbi:MAG: c-type cytochrome [Acidobacteria bacterium]|nr:c-type cytochrome [Acidobacteriota bacterium]
MRLALAIASFIILIVHGLVFYDQFFHKWENHQTAYFDQARQLAKTDAERAALEGRSPRIEQVIVRSFGEERVDRCMTCHIGSDDPRFNGYGHPLKSHPYAEAMGDRMVNGVWERRHKFSDFGCTVCHDGQGRGLEAFYAHGEDHYWPDPLMGYVTQNWNPNYKTKLVGKEFMQASCAQCHTEENFSSTPLVAAGRKLFFEKNCYGCHKIEGMANGTLGPDLSEVGKKFKLDYLWESIVEPRANSAVSFMPKFKLNDIEVKALTIFLKSRRGVNFAETSLDRYRASLRRDGTAAAVPTAGTDATATPATPAGPTLAAMGEKLISDRSCLACHKLGAVDGGVAPDLSFAGLLKDETWMMDHFRDPRSRISDSIMPAFGFPDTEYRAMTAYLLGLKSTLPGSTPAEAFVNNCVRCHGNKGDGKGMIAVYLDPAPRDLTKVGFMNSKPADRLIASIKNGVAGTSMPAWKNVLSDDQIQGVFDYINKTFVKEDRRTARIRKVPETNPVTSSAQSIAGGESIYLQRCTGCHGKKADGKGPNSIDMVPRPRNLRNIDFMNSIDDRRLFDSILYGVQGAAMPPWIDYGLSQKDVGDLVNYLRSLNKKK